MIVKDKEVEFKESCMEKIAIGRIPKEM